MKNALVTKCVDGLVLIACLSTPPGFASKTSPLDLVKKDLKAATPIEMPAKASQLVSRARVEEREAMAEAVVAATHTMRPVALIAVVSAVAKDNPAVAPSAAAKAAALQPKEAAAIARAAASATPAQAAKIVYAVCKAVPMKYGTVATAVAQVSPESSKEIIAAVIEAVPGLKPFVERASSGNMASVGAVMGQTETLVQVTAQTAKTTPEKLITAPVVASSPPVSALPPPSPPDPPYHPYPGSPTELNVTNTIEVPPGGGRNYSGP